MHIMFNTSPRFEVSQLIAIYKIKFIPWCYYTLALQKFRYTLLKGMFADLLTVRKIMKMHSAATDKGRSKASLQAFIDLVQVHNKFTMSCVSNVIISPKPLKLCQEMSIILAYYCNNAYACLKISKLYASIIYQPKSQCKKSCSCIVYNIQR